MTWSPKPPAGEGWWWYRAHPLEEAQVIEADAQGRVRFGHQLGFYPPPPGEYAGPIPEPADP